MTEKTPQPDELGAASCSAFWLRGWHRAFHKLDHAENRYADTVRLKRGRAAAKFTLAEWRFHYDRKPNSVISP